MTKHKITLSKLVLAFSLLGILAGCSNDSTETTPKPSPSARQAGQLGPQESEMLQASAKGDTARVQELLSKGVDVNMRGVDRNTPIMEAAYAGHLDTVKALLDHGADLSAKKNDGATPIALSGRNKEVTELLKRVVALVEAATKGDLPAMKSLIDKGTPVNGLDEGGTTALAGASYMGKIDAVKLLLEKGANPTIKKTDGETPLTLATARQHPDIVAVLNEAIAKQSKGEPTAPAPKATPAAK